MRKLRPLDWNNAACVGMDGINREVRAVEDVWLHGRIRIYILYSIMRYDYNPQLMENFSRPQYRASIMIDGKDFREKCLDFDDGKDICETWRNKFWSDLLDEIDGNILEGGSNDRNKYYL